MQFNQYLKQCREQIHLTQEQLVHNLYLYNSKYFSGLESSTLSKWERAIVKPHLARQVEIIRYFQTLTKTALPCWEKYSTNDTEEMICKTGMKNLLGKSKELILNFPEKMIGTDEIQVFQLRNSEMLGTIIDLHMELDKGFKHKFKEVPPTYFKEWSLHPSNFFYQSTYKGQFFGLLFALRLKPEIFEKIINLEIREKDLRVEDFASFDEMGSSYITSFFAMNEKAASLLFIRYYAHLIANQKVIEEVGVSVIMDDAKKLLANMNLTEHQNMVLDDGSTLQTYRESLSRFLASEQTIKMILSKQECPEE